MSAVLQEIHDLFYPPPPPSWGATLLKTPLSLASIVYMLVSKVLTVVAWTLGIPAYILTWPAFVILRILGFRRHSMVWDLALLALAAVAAYALYARAFKALRRLRPVTRAAAETGESAERSAKNLYRRLSSASTEIGEAVHLAKDALNTLRNFKGGNENDIPADNARADEGAEQPRRRRGFF